MKKPHLILCVILVLDCSPSTAQPGHRDTHNHTSVSETRVAIPPEDTNYLLDLERTTQQLYPEAILVHSVAEFQYRRNCHDYAFAPYMGPAGSIYGPSGPQSECWWMVDPSANWKDGSLANVVTSVPFASWQITDYAFQTDDLDWLPYLYYDNLVYLLPLPACELNDLNGPAPQHAAVLVDWFTPSELNDPSVSVGIFESKWANIGIFQHRWGAGFCPLTYCDSEALRIFAPAGRDWVFNSPPYLIYPLDPFGPPY